MLGRPWANGHLAEETESHRYSKPPDQLEADRLSRVPLGPFLMKQEKAQGQRGLAVAPMGKGTCIFGRAAQGFGFVDGLLIFRLGVAVIDHAAAGLNV